MDYLLKEYVALVHFLGNFIGHNTEIVLHDTSMVDNSVVAIVNGHISGRKLGSSLNGAGLSYIRNKIYQDKDELIDYKGFSKDGKELVCYTRFIKNEEGKLLGMICVNIDKTQEIEVLSKLTSLFGFDEESKAKTIQRRANREGNELKEHFPENVQETVESVFQEILAELNLPADRLTYNEKVLIMKKFEENGVFLFKGAIPEVAKQLSISEATAYRYLSKIERGEI